MTRGNEAGHQGHTSKIKLFFKHMSVICLFSMMFMFILTGCSTSTKGEDESGEIIPINETESTPEAAIELKEDAESGINELFVTYFADLAKGDVEALGKIMVNAPDKDTVAKEIEYIEDYQNIKCYSKEGVLDGTYVVYVYYEVKFKNIDTLAPSMIREYVCTNEDGKLYINNGTVDGEVAAWLEEVHASDSAVELVNNVNNALSKAAESDEKLSSLITKLNEGAGRTEESSEAETKAQESEKETSKEETKESETAKNSEETTKAAETTVKETTKAAETTAKETTKEAAKETEYKAFDKKVTMYAQENLNIRQKASSDSKLLGKLIAGDSITALGTTGEWTVVSYKNSKAYILSELLGKKKPDLGVSFKEVDETVEATQNVRMRKQPNANAEVAGTLPGGTKVTRTGYDKKWSRIVYNGKTLYVATEYLQ